MGYLLEEMMLEELKRKMREDEKSTATMEKYLRDVKLFYKFMDKDVFVTKGKVIEYKQYLIDNYAVSSVNSMLASLNYFMKGRGWYDCTVKSLKVQKESFRLQDRELTKDEYVRLLTAAKKKKNLRLYLLMQTLCATGIRISELKFITVETLFTGRAQVSLKGKTRTVILPVELCRKLNAYAVKLDIKNGSIFVTRSGQPLDRSNICHDMKALYREAGVLKEKIFPHNLRHLFACTYYQEEKDITHLADLLGHSSINTTRIYTLSSGEEQARQIEALGLIV